ncbi:MAG: TIGR02922 family protein [Colwelliaceae bacterium]|nr:TIGR02922 family protein [Colwelliaceae bacterium]
MESELRKVTIIYYSDLSLELMHEVATFPQNKNGRVIISDSFKKDKSIIAVCDGEAKILNKVGDRADDVGFQNEA